MRHAGEQLIIVERHLAGAVSRGRGETYKDLLTSNALYEALWATYTASHPAAAAAALPVVVGNALPAAARPTLFWPPAHVTLERALDMVGEEAYKNMYRAKYPADSAVNPLFQIAGAETGERIPNREYITNPANKGKLLHTRAVHALNQTQIQWSYLTGEVTPLEIANGVLIRHRVLDDGIADHFARVGGVSSSTRSIRDQAHTAALAEQKNPFGQLKLFKVVPGARAILVADNVDFGAAAARDGGVHHMALLVKLTFDEDPYQNEAYLAALAKSGLELSSMPVVTRVPKFEKPDAVPLPKRDVNPPAAAHRPRFKTELARNGKTFELSAESTEDDFLADYFPETFAVWLKAAVDNTATRSGIVKTLVQAAGDLRSWPAVLRASADLAAVWPLYVLEHVKDAATMEGRRVGSIGRMTSRPHEEVAYAYATHTLGIDDTSRIGDHRKKTSMDDDRPQYQVIVPLTPILENPTGDKAMTLTVLLAIRLFDLFDQTAGLLVVDGGLFKKAVQMVWPHEEYKKRIMVSNGDFHITKTAHAAISAITKESGIAHLLVKSGVFDGITSAEHALSGGHVDNAMIGYSDLYLGLHGRLFDMWHAEALETDDMDEGEEEEEGEEDEEDGAAMNEHAISQDEFATVKEALDAVNKGGAPGVAAAAVGSALGIHLEKYRGFLERVAKRTGNAAMWIQILRWIEIVLQHRRLMRSPEATPEYVDMLEQLHTLCTLADRHNYAKGLAVQIAQWSTIKECYPSLLEYSNDQRWLLSANDLGINGHGKEHDLIIEYLNKRIKAGKGGITKLASSPDHFAAWFLCCTYRGQMETMAQAFAPVTKRALGKGKMGTYSRVEYRRPRSKREGRELAKLKALLADDRGNNPFAGADLALVQERSLEAAEAESKMITRLTTGAALPDKVAASMLGAWAQGRERAILMLDRITCENNTAVWAHATLLNIGRYGSKAVKPPKADRLANEMIGCLFFYLFQLVVSGANLGDATVKPEELLEYGLTTGGAGSLFKPDGTMLKSNKSKWIEPLLGAPAAHPGNPPQKSLLIWDFMAMIRKVHIWTKHDIVAFGSVAETVLRGNILA